MTVYVDVARTTEVAMSLRARSTSEEPLATLVTLWDDRPGLSRTKTLTWSGNRQDCRHGASKEGSKLEHLHDEDASGGLEGRAKERAAGQRQARSQVNC